MKIWYREHKSFVPCASLVEALGIRVGEKRIAFVGAGGKTTILFALADEFRAKGKRVLITTSTHIRRPAGFFITDRDLPGVEKALAENGAAVVGSGVPERKLSAPQEEFLAQASQLVDFVLIEADGSRMLPAKAPAEHEPVLHGDEQLVVAVVGMPAWGKPIREVCHRPEKVMAILGKSSGDILTSEDVAMLLTHPHGGRKLVQGRFAVIMNQVNTGDDFLKAQQCAEHLQRLLQDNSRILAVGR